MPDPGRDPIPVVPTRSRVGVSVRLLVVARATLMVLSLVVGTEMGPTRKPRVATAELQIKGVAQAVTLFMKSNRRIPTWDDLTRVDEAGYAWIECYGPLLDPWDHPYEITADRKRPGHALVSSRGPDGLLDTEDDLTSESLPR